MEFGHYSPSKRKSIEHYMPAEIIYSYPTLPNSTKTHSIDTLSFFDSVVHDLLFVTLYFQVL